MRWVIVCVMGIILIAGEQAVFAAHPVARDADVSLYGPVFKVGTLKFTIPSKWVIESSDNPARAGQWLVPPLHGQGEGGEVVAFFFGPGLGGSTKDNIEAWIGTMFNAEGHPAAAEVKTHQTAGFNISQVVIFGTYNQVVPLPGVPPRPRSNYGLLGAVIENPKGNIYWRFTGPEPLITASIPLFNKIIDSVKPQDK
jgi:hypothetical protein